MGFTEGIKWKFMQPSLFAIAQNHYARKIFKQTTNFFALKSSIFFSNFHISFIIFSFFFLLHNNMQQQTKNSW